MRKIFLYLIFLLSLFISPSISFSRVSALHLEKKISEKDSIPSSVLKDLVISANKVSESRKHVAQQINVISSSDIRSLNTQTTADLLQTTGSVFVQRSQQGGGSPVLRGFEASRVLLVVDGVRLNNAIYRSGHLQNVITLDYNVMSRTEVLFGPSSTIYGSDALGGVVHFYTRTPTLSGSGLRSSGNMFLRYGSANQERSWHGDLTLRNKKWGSLTSFTLSYYDDLRMGKKNNPALGREFGKRYHYVERSADNTSDRLVKNSNSLIQKFSGYNQYDFLQKFLFRPGKRADHILNLQFSTSTNVPRYDRLTDPTSDGLKSAEWYYGPQKRWLASYQLTLSPVKPLGDQLVCTVSFQDIKESRHNRNFDNPLRHNRVENVQVFGATFDVHKKWGDRHSLRYGFDSQFNYVKSTAYTEHVITGLRETPLDTRYPKGGSSMNYWAAYASHTWVLHPQFTLTEGLRLGQSTLRADFQNSDFLSFSLNGNKWTQKANYASGSIGVIYSPGLWKFSVLGNSGFRVPNIDDLSKVFESKQGSASSLGILIVPNAQLVPEKTINGDFTLTRSFGRTAQVEGVFYITQLYDAIVTRNASIRGRSIVDYHGFPAQVMSNQNVGKAYIYGYGIHTSWDIFSSLQVKASYNYTYGRVLEDDGLKTPLDHIPPIYGRGELRYKKRAWTARFFCLFNGWKRLNDYSNSGEDNLQYATSKGTPSWYTLHARLSYQVNSFFTLQVGGDNLLDLQYRPFASGINAPGRHLFITARLRY